MTTASDQVRCMQNIMVVLQLCDSSFIANVDDRFRSRHSGCQIQYKVSISSCLMCFDRRWYPCSRLEPSTWGSNSGRKLPHASQAAGVTGRGLVCTSQYGTCVKTYLVKSLFHIRGELRVRGDFPRCPYPQSENIVDNACNSKPTADICEGLW